MRDIDPQKSYYALTLTADEGGTITWSAQTHWVGFADGDFHREIRAASIVLADRLEKLWTDLRQPYVVVNEEEHLYVYWSVGGTAFVEQQLAEKWLPEIIAPQPTARSGRWGFKSLASFPGGAFNRAPTPKQRQRIFKRDGRRCKICGRRPADYVDVQLRLHHVRMWKSGGLTEDDNLITLCHTCHDGLDPHEDLDLFELIDPERVSDGVEGSRRQLRKGVMRYRKIVAKVNSKEDTD
jgi:hypothetical protein